jgi:signal transduction histidine kinase
MQLKRLHIIGIMAVLSILIPALAIFVIRTSPCLDSNTYFKLPATPQNIEQHYLPLTRSCTLFIKLHVPSSDLSAFLSTTFISGPLTSNTIPASMGGRSRAYSATRCLNESAYFSANFRAEALKLPYSAIELKEQGSGAFQLAAEYRRGGKAYNGEREALPLTYQSETVGRLQLGLRAPGEPFSAADRRLLEDLARQAGAAVQAAQLTGYLQRLTADLQRSRERLVTAREEERRRLRRDLHDGLGPMLANLTLQLEAARDLLADDPAAADALLAKLTAQAQGAIADIRRLVYELRPPALDEFGLLFAIQEQAAQYSYTGIQFRLDAPDRLPALPAAVEVATYRIVQEALTNVVRHAGARCCEIFLTVTDDLYLDIRDDGWGIHSGDTTGVGLNSMRERADELGGVCTIDSSADGTHVRARLPLFKPQEAI